MKLQIESELFGHHFKNVMKISPKPEKDKSKKYPKKLDQQGHIGVSLTG